jgi:hypothetical protein
MLLLFIGWIALWWVSTTYAQRRDRQKKINQTRA